MEDFIIHKPLLKGSAETWIIILVVYFSVLIVSSLVSAVLIWKPPTQSSGTNSTHSLYIPLSSTIKSSSVPSAAPGATNSSKTISNNASGTTIRNITSYILTDRNLRKETTITTFIPSSLERETRLIELSLLFGVIGSCVHGVTSLTIWHSRKRIERSFFSWYVTRPMVGAALAVTVYLLLRSTLLTTISIGPQSGAITFINEYGVAGISALVGLMTAQMTQKLRDVFDSMFGIQKGTDKGDIDIDQEDNITLIPKELQLSTNHPSVLVAMVKDNAHKPISNINVDFGIVDNNIVKSVDGSQTKTDTNGMATLVIQGINGSRFTTKIHAAIELAGKPVYASSTVKVT